MENFFEFRIEFVKNPRFLTSKLTNHQIQNPNFENFQNFSI